VPGVIPDWGITMNEFFAKMAKRVSAAVGSPYAFVAAAGAVMLWVVSGPVFGYSQNWQLVINTGTTIITFLMVFVIQNAQNRDQKALQLKLDELLRATKGAETGFVDLENLDDATLRGLERHFKALHEKHAGHENDEYEGETARTNGGGA
jgi:low affinity Fe/Cu permease